MANFPSNPQLFVPPGLHVEHGWMRPARARVALGGEPIKRHEQYAIITVEPALQLNQVRNMIHHVSAFLQHEFSVRVVSAFPSPFGLGLFEFEDPIQRACLLDASPINSDFGVIAVVKHDEARNLKACPYTREGYIMFLGFPLDYQTHNFVKADVAPFGRLIRWFEGPNKSRVLVQCLKLSPERIPRSIVLSQGTLMGGTGRSWSIPMFLLSGQFPDVFLPDEDPVPADGNPHPDQGEVGNVNLNVNQMWQHDLVGIAPVVQQDAGVNNEQVNDFQEELHPLDENVQENDVEEENGWPAWQAQNEM